MEAQENKLKCSIITYQPQAHIQVCYLIGTAKAHITESELYDSEFYGKFVVEGDNEFFERLGYIPNIKVELIND